jgi:hypothetical protein
MIQDEPIYEIIVSSVESFTRTLREDFSADNRKGENVFPRQLVMYFLKNHTKYRLREIGEIYGKCHAGVINSERRIKDRIFGEKDLREFVEETDDFLNIYNGKRSIKKVAIFLDLVMQFTTPKEQIDWIKRYNEAV